MTSNDPSDFAAAEARIRAGCCDTWPKPCSYHEGWLDGLDVGRQVLAPEIVALTEQRDALKLAAEKAMWVLDAVSVLGVFDD